MELVNVAAYRNVLQCNARQFLQHAPSEKITSCICCAAFTTMIDCCMSRSVAIRPSTVHCDDVETGGLKGSERRHLSRPVMPCINHILPKVAVQLQASTKLEAIQMDGYAKHRTHLVSASTQKFPSTMIETRIAGCLKFVAVQRRTTCDHMLDCASSILAAVVHTQARKLQVSI